MQVPPHMQRIPIWAKSNNMGKPTNICAYRSGYNKNLHIQRDQFIIAANEAKSVKELCIILGKSKPSVYTYAKRFGISIHKRYGLGAVRRQDGYFHYNNKQNHRRIFEGHFGVKLKMNDSIHHIDGDKNNNRISNLIKLGRSQHQKAHSSIEKCGFFFLRKGLIEFNFRTKLYNVSKAEVYP